MGKRWIGLQDSRLEARIYFSWWVRSHLALSGRGRWRPAYAKDRHTWQSPSRSFKCLWAGPLSHFPLRSTNMSHAHLFVCLFLFFYFLTLQYCIGFAIYQHEPATGIHVFPNLNPPPSSLPVPSLWVVPVYQPQASSIMHRTWAGDSFHIWYYTCFNAILPNHPTLSLSHGVQKTVLYLSVSFAVLYTGLLLPSF